MKHLISRVWKIVRGTENPVWLTMLITVSMTVFTGMRDQAAQAQQRHSLDREATVKEYTLTVTEYTHQLFVVSASLEDYSYAFNNWYSRLVQGASGDTAKRLSDTAGQSEDDYIKQDTELAHFILKLKASEEQLLKISPETKVLHVLEDSPRSYISRVDYIGVSDKFQTASPAFRAELATDLKAIGDQMVPKLKQLSSIYRLEYESAYSGFTRAIQQQ